ncbi:hypothetical protein DMUE_3417 [Dictyocoela muelleri]|nr:hypothetical protein DMUE_3417 [Dictyocoela muelleri]
MISLCLAHEFMKLQGMKNNLNNKKRRIRSDRKMDYLDLWTAYYSQKNKDYNNHSCFKKETDNPIIALDEKFNFKCKNQNCNNYNLVDSNNCEWNNLNNCECNNLNNEMTFEFKDGDFDDRNNFDDRNYFDEEKYLDDKNDFQSVNYNFSRSKTDKYDSFDNNLKSPYSNYYHLNENQNSPCLNICHELAKINTTITKPEETQSTFHPIYNVDNNQKKINENVINSTRDILQSNNTPRFSNFIINNSEPYNNFSSFNNHNVSTKHTENNESYIPTIKYESIFNSISDKDGQTDNSKKSIHLNQYFQNEYPIQLQPSKYQTSKSNEVKNELNPALNNFYQNLKYDDLSKYDLTINPEIDKNTQNKTLNELISEEDFMNKDQKSKEEKDQKNNKDGNGKNKNNNGKKTGSDKKKNSKNNCVGYISTLTIVWSAMFMLI